MDPVQEFVNANEFCLRVWVVGLAGIYVMVISMGMSVNSYGHMYNLMGICMGMCMHMCM